LVKIFNHLSEPATKPEDMIVTGNTATADSINTGFVLFKKIQ
jgi:hypothetical protein